MVDQIVIKELTLKGYALEYTILELLAIQNKFVWK